MSYVNSTLIKNACNLFYFSQLYMPNVSQKKIFLKLSSLQFVNKIFNRSQFWNKYHRDALYKKHAHFVSFKSPNHNRNISSFLENIIIFISILLKGKKWPCVKFEDAHHFGFICKKYSNAGYKFRYITRKVKFIIHTF